MTEEIIIDGVDVKDCRRRIGKENYCRYYKRGCADNNYNCIWKKCLRLEQENKELKEMLSKEPKAMQAFQISYSGLKRDNETLWGMVKDYKTALEEIREIAKDIIENDVYENSDVKAEKILNKINEVLNG